MSTEDIDDLWKEYKGVVIKRLGWLGAFLVVVGYPLNANMHPSSWVVWGIGNVLIGIYSLSNKAYPTAVMSFIIMIMNIYGYITWL